MITKLHAQEILDQLNDTSATLDPTWVKQTASELANEVIRRASAPRRLFKVVVIVPKVAGQDEGERERKTYLVAARSESRAEAKVLSILPPELAAEIEDGVSDLPIPEVTEETNPYHVSTGAEG